MSRLTKDIREQMARKLVAHRYTDEAKEIMHKDRSLFERAYNHRYTKDVLKHVEALRKEFPNLFIERSSFRTNAGGYRVSIGDGFRSRWVKVESDPKRSKRWMVNDYGDHNISDEVLIEEIKAYADQSRAFEGKCETAYYEAMAVLNTVSSGKKLAEAWPEAMPVIGDLIPEGCRTLPVVQVADVNKKFGLPPKSKKETV